ncbi:InlB B-repeat-containing protein [Bifidobacterium pseudocatenulatum]|uniref:InlB B-repeat-containing protein n=1 Tax=Bifidobacterium pseudocatenulatum TaxID=28026 RepID=UPI0034A26D31
MGFLTRLIAGLVAASTLGAGLAGTAGAVDTTGATGDAKDVVKLASDDTSGLPDHLVNGDFEYPGANVLSKNRYDEKASGNWWGVSRKDKMVYDSDHETQWVSLPSTFDSGKFAWDSTEVAGTQNGSSQWHTNEVEFQRDSRTGNMYGELCAYQANTSIRQYIRTTPGVLYKVRLKHASLSRDYLDKMQVLIGPAGNEQPVRMTRVGSQNGLDATGESTASTTVSTHASNEMEIKDGQGTPYSSRNHDGQWATYEGVYVATSDVTSFTFKSVDAKAWNLGNLLDDIVFDKAYRLSYDKNASDASGQVPSNERGRENTVQPAKAKTTGTVKTVADENVRYGSLAKTNGSVRLAADDDVAEYAANGLPEQIVNGGFDYPSVPSWTALPESVSNKYNKGKLYATINPGTGKYGSGCSMSTSGKAIPNWNRSNFAWSSTQGDTHYSGGMSCEAGNVELNYDSVHHNQFAELTADQQGTAIYQDVKVTPGTMMKWSLKHSSTTSAYVDKMQVMIGEPYKETAQEATRIASENGNKVGEKMTTISTPTTSDRADNKKWDTYSGTYLVPDGVTTVRFTFKSIASAEWYSGNDLDDIEFSRSYKLTYDKNSSDAAGEVPSNQRGKENTTQPARTRTSGTVRTVADDAAGRTVLECKQSGEGATGPYADNFCWIDWSNLPLSRTGEPIPVRINVPGGHIDADATITHTNNAALAAKDFIGSKWSRLTSAYKLTGNTALAFSGRMGRQDPAASVTFSNITPSADRTDTGVNVLKDFRLAFGDAEVMSGGVLQGHDVYEQTDIESDKTLEKLGMIGSGDLNQSYSKANTGYGTTHVTLAGGPKGATDDVNKDSKGSAVVGAKQASQFKVSFKQVNQHWDGWGSAIAVGVYMPYLTAYPLTYDKNASDATGEVPSNQRGRENTTQPAKDKTSGTVRLASDDDVVEYAANGLPKQIMNGDFDHDWRNIVGQSKMSEKYNFANIDPAHGDVEISGALNNKGEASKQWVHLNGFDASQFGWKSNQTDTRVDGRGGIVEIQRSRANDNMYAEITASQADTYLYQDIDTAHDYPTVYTVKLRYAHRNGTINSNEKIQILVGAPGHEQPVEMTRIASDRGNKLGEKSTTVNAPNTDGWLGSWDTFQGSVVVPAGQNVSRFTFKALGSIDGVSGNLIDDVQFKLAYKLSYDKNSQDASGQIPSDETANTVKQAKAKSSGGVRLAADRTDGKVSDLVQRTTTHEDGSVTVRTVDTTTDVVSGCQVYYPAGQRITLATLAKDGDCWDSSMLTRPGHTQLGWSQDSQATQAQAEVTMVEGGMTVYAVWVGNPVLTYDTNKPNTWNGQMPSTPASVSVAYNTAAADGSGWQSGDTSKIRGYRFLGWYAGPQDDAGLYDWNTPLTGNVTVYAHWERLKANVVYDRNAKDAKGSHANTTGWQYSDVTVPSDTSKSFKRAGYVFLGWDTQADGNGTAYKDGSQVPLQDKDITLYAQWQPVFEQFTPTGGVSLPLLVAGGVTLLVMGIGSTVMLTRRMRGEQ